MVYAIWLTGLGVLFVALERLWPRRPDQRLLRGGLLTDIAYIIFNSEYSGILIGLATIRLIEAANAVMDLAPLRRTLYLGIASDWPLWLQVITLLLSVDFLKWCIHNLLHRVPALWEFHKVHHSVVEMDWIGNWRFHWMETLVYRALLFVPSAWLGFRPEVMFGVGVFDTLMGHFAHANLSWSVGWLRYVINSPEMHMWHHNHPKEGPVNRNFALSLSIWDWLFGTAWLPDHDPTRLGFTDVERFPKGIFGQWLAPFAQLFGSLRSRFADRTSPN